MLQETNWLGFTWVPYEALDITGTTATTLAWCSSAAHFGTGYDYEVDIGVRRDKNNAIVLLMRLGYLYYLNDRLESTKAKLELANQNISSLNHYIDKTNQQLDKDYQEKLTHAQTENDKLRDSIANGIKRLYVKTNCPMPTNTATASKPDATSRAELDREVGQLIIRIVQDGDHAIIQLNALQKYVNEVCLVR